MSLREHEIIHWGKLLFERRLISGWGGNLSCRADNERFLITAQHAPLGFLTPNHVVQIDRAGKPINPEQRASSETPMHLAIYAGTEAQAIVHVHPPMVLAFSLAHQTFTPISFEEKYTIGAVPVIAQDTPTVTRPEQVVEELKYRPVVILQGHGTVAIGDTLQDAFLLTDLLEEAVRCQYFRAIAGSPGGRLLRDNDSAGAQPERCAGEGHELFSQAHLEALVEIANCDSAFRAAGHETGLTTSLTLSLDEARCAWTVNFADGEITGLEESDSGVFRIAAKAEWWKAVFANRIDPFLATQQKKLRLERGELAAMSRWYKPFQRAFTLWQTIPVR